MALYDIEDFLTDVGAKISAGFNARVTAINSEKADSITLATLDFNRSDTLHMQWLQSVTVDADPFIVYGLASSVDAEGIGPATKSVFDVIISLVLADSGADANIPKKLFRYQRALSDLVHANWDTMGKTGIVKITGEQPTPAFTLFNDSRFHRAVAVSFKTVMA